MVLKTSKDIEDLPPTTKEVRICSYLTIKMVKDLLSRCTKLKLVVFTETARKKTSRNVLGYLMSQGIDLVHDHFAQGRPIKFSRLDLAKMKSLHDGGLSYGKIAKRIGVCRQTVMRALQRKTKFCRWSEDYNGKGKVVWIVSRDADPDAQKLADNHYSRKTRGSKFFCGPGEKLVLMTPDKRALFVWRKNKIRWDGQNGVECSLFRNEGADLSSGLILHAVRLAKKRWPGERLFTYIDPNAIKSTNPGFCFKRAGWHTAGTNKNGKLILMEVHV